MNEPRLITEDLRECPLCGGPVTMEVSEPHDHVLAQFMPPSPGYVMVSCDSCGCSIIDDGQDMTKTRQRWNARPGDEVAWKLIDRDRYQCQGPDCGEVYPASLLDWNPTRCPGCGAVIGSFDALLQSRTGGR